MIQYVRNIGIVLYNAEGKIFLGQRVRGGWSMPQGDCEPGESDEDAMRRELYEETGLSNISQLEFLLGEFSYIIPGGGGKIQKWAIAKWNGGEEISFDKGPYQEFTSHIWAAKKDVIERCVWFKKEIYKEVLARYHES